jgi:ribonuclease P protein component
MSVEGTERFPKSARLRKRPQFLRLSRSGKKSHTPNFVVICEHNDCGETRLGITVSGKVGNAVVRNRIKRLVREFFRRRRHELAPGLDILVIAKKTAADVSLTSVENELRKSLGNHRSYAK